jgi:2-haloacid dehalogenase
VLSYPWEAADMNSYEIFLFDADDTLYDFDRAEAHALETMFAYCDLDYTEHTLKRYREINSLLWESYEKGEVSKEDLQTLRFSRLFHEGDIHCDEGDFNQRYLAELGKGAFLIDGVLDICREIVSHGKLIFIVSNGILATQEARLRHSLIREYVSDFFVSEFVGYKKPEIEYFTYVFSHIPQVGMEKILLVGDSLQTDIAGGNHAGVDTCWFNRDGRENRTDIRPTYEIRRLMELGRFVR